MSLNQIRRAVGRSVVCFLAMLVSIGFLASPKLHAQTTLISPTGDGGFENGSTFSANGWTVVNGATNQWFVGSVASPYSGNNSAYISDNSSGTTYNYTTSSASSVVHFYRDVTFPTGETNIVLSFKWKAGGESNYDYLTVYSMPTSVTPTVNTPSAGSQNWLNIPTSYSGAVVHSTPPNLNLQSTYQTQSICLPSSYAGTTRRLVFMWSNDGSAGVQPPGSIDEIQLVTSSTTTAAPANSPTSLSLTPFLSKINGSFTASTSTDAYLVVRYPAGATPVSPVNGTSYIPGATLGTGKVMSAGGFTTFSTTGLTPGTSYDFYVYSYNIAACNSGPLYKTISPLFGNISTLSCSTGLSGTYSVGPTGTYTTLTAALAAFGNLGVASNVVFELQPTYTSAGETFPITFPLSVCSGSSQTLTVRPQAGASGLTITSANTTATVDLNGAAYVTVDGRPGGTGTASQLTIANTSTSGVAIRFINDALNNTVKYCSVTGVNSSATSGTILFSTTTGTAGNDNNTIDNCDILDGATTPTNAVYSSGTTAAAAQNNSNNTISNNRISNYFAAAVASAGVRLDGGNTDWTIATNRFFQTATRTQTTGTQHSAVWVNNSSGNNFQITGNTIGYASAAGTGTYTFVGLSSTSLVPIYLSVGTTTVSGVQGNTITAIAQSGSSSGTSGSGPFRAIYVSTGLANIGNVTGNTIGSLTATGSITYTSSSTSASDVIGVHNLGSSSWIVANNNIGGITVSNSSSGAANLYGLRVNTGTGVTSTFQNNTIGGTVANSMQSTSTATGTQVAGILNTTSNATITGNIIRNLTAAGGTGTTTAASVVGISLTNTSVNNTVSQNTIFNLSNSNTSASTIVTSIQYTSSSGTNIVERNFIYGLTSASNSSTAEINGIRIAGGTATYRNNMIAVGAGTANAILVSGINEPSGTDNFWHNSVYVGGSATAGSANSFAFNSTVTSNTRSFRDNIFVNARSNSGATGKNYAVQVGGTAANPSGLTINNNIYYITGSGTVFGRFNSADVVDLTAWRIAVGQDAASIQGDPQYSSPAATVPDLHLSATNPTVAEGTGVDMGVVDDFDGQTRASLTPVDIGADAGNFIQLDIFGPIVSYTALTNTSCTSSATRTLSSVIITDYSGVNTTTGTKPRLYFRKSTDANTYAGNTSSDNGWKFVEANNTSSPFSFTIDYSKLQSAIAISDVIQYFLVAQDNAATPNITINSGVFTTSPSSVSLTSSAFPINGAINSYSIVAAGLSGAVTIGAAGTYTSLTGASGLFNAINTFGLSNSVTATIIDASITETGAVTLNAFGSNGCGAGPSSVLIKPATSITATLTGSLASAALIRINGASDVTIDGSNNGGTSRDLIIVNTSTTAPTAISLSSAGTGLGARNITIKNCAIATGVASSTGYGISVGASTPGSSGADNDNITIQNDSITVAPIGIYAVGTASVSTGGDDNLNITGNVIDYNGALACIGIQLGNALNSSISQNTVTEQCSTTSAPTGISLETGFVSSTVTRNNITKVLATSSGGYGGRGITVGTGIATSNLTIANNFVSGVNGTNWSSFGNSSSMGIAIGMIGNSTTISTTTGGINLYNNTVSLTGTMNTGSTSAITAALYVGSGASALDIRNNIFSNTQVGTNTSQKNYAIYSAAANTAFTLINNNDYDVSNSFNAASANVGYLSSDRTTLANWQTASGQDAQSTSVAAVFVSTSDLHLVNTAGANWCLNGTGATIPAVTTDIDLQARTTPPDIGADEFTPTDNSTATPSAQTSCSGSAITTIAFTGAAGTFTWTRNNTATVTGIAASGTGNIAGSLTNTTNSPVIVTFTITPLNANGCAFGSPITATVVVNPIPNDVVSPASQTICTGNTITTITHNGNVTGTVFDWTRDNTATVTGIAATGTGSISGTLTNTTALPVMVTFTTTPTYTNAGATCTGTPATATAIINPTNTVSLSSAAGTDAQTLCINTPIANITYTTSGATGATFAGLPAGVSGAWLGNVATISGTPTASGTFSYSVTLTGGCGTITAIGSITVTPANTITLTSTAGSNAQAVCINNSINNVTYASTGATGATVTGLPAGVIATYAANVVTISGTPTGSGVYNYTVTLLGGCGTVNTTGSITVSPNNTIALTSAAGTDAQVVCNNTSVTSITYATTGATGVTITGLPTGVTGSLVSNVVTINGSPAVAGTFNYTVTLTGGCGTASTSGSITVINTSTIVLTSTIGTNVQSLCVGTPITNITYATTGATGATFTGLPAGLTGTFVSNVVTISGSPSATGTFNYTVNLTGGCSSSTTASGTITVAPNSTVSLSSAASTSAQTLCINTPIVSTTYTTSAATGATVSGLPAGVTGSWSANVVTISGTPTVSGTYNYVVTPTGGCGSATATGSITVNPNNAISLTSTTGTNVQSICINTPVTNITYATVGGTGATFSGLPAGLTGVWAANVITISGSPTVAGTFNYTVSLTGGPGCGGTVTATGTITVRPDNTITLSSTAGTNTQTRCINTAITNITYTTTSATGATFSGLPTGVTGAWAGNVVTITGTPTVSGTFIYVITLTGGCGSVTAGGTITVTPNNTATLSSGFGTNAQNVCINTAITPITYVTTGATGATFSGLPAGVSGVWVGSLATISGTPTVAGTFNYTLTLTGGCGITTANGSIVVTPTNTIALTSAAGTNVQTRCMNSAINNITYASTGATGATFIGLPAGVTGVKVGNVITISGAPSVAGTFSYTVTLTGGCGLITAAGIITVNPLPTISVSPATAATICSGTGITLTASGASTYVWSPATGLSATTGTSVVANPAASTTYNVTGTDANGCVSSTTKLVTVNGLPNITITPAGPVTFCEGLSTTLAAFGAATYTWSPGTGLSSTTGSSVVASPTTTTTYTITGTGANGCVNTATKTVTIIPAPDPTITPAGYIDICQDDTVHFSAKAGYTAYVWMLYGVPVTTATTNNFPTVTGGFYTLKVTDVTGCTATTSAPSVITVTQHPLPVITRTGAVLDAGGPFASYQWYVGGVLISGATSRTYTPTVNGMYTVSVTDPSPLHCPGKSEAYNFGAVGVPGVNVADAIKLYPNPANNIIHIDAPISVNVTVSSMDGKQVFTGNDRREINIGAFADGIYRVLITNKNGDYLRTEKVTKVSR